MLASLILLGAATGYGLRIGRRLHRRRLNERLHELRRPLQGLAIAAAPGRTEPGRERELHACLEAVADAAQDLDRAVNGGPRRPRSSRFSIDSLIDDARRRWGFCGSVEIGAVPTASLSGDRVRIAAALDNLIANAIEHGGGRARVTARSIGGRIRIQVRNRAPAAGRATAPAAEDPLRGHGLRVAGRIATEQGGLLHAPRLEAGEVLAELDLPAPVESAG